MAKKLVLHSQYEEDSEGRDIYSCGYEEDAHNSYPYSLSIVVQELKIYHIWHYKSFASILPHTCYKYDSDQTKKPCYKL